MQKQPGAFTTPKEGIQSPQKLEGFVADELDLSDLPKSISSAPPVSPLKVLWRIPKIALPMGLSFTFSFTVFAIGILIGHISDGKDKTDRLGASTLITTMLNALEFMAIGLTFAVSLFAGNRIGRLKKQVKESKATERVLEESISEESKSEDTEPVALIDEISAAPKNSLIMSSVILPVPMSLMYFSKFFLMQCGQSEETAEIAQTYLRASMGVIPFAVGRMVFEQTLFGFKKQNSVMLISLASFAIAIFLAISLCFGKFGFPQLGLEGIAYGFTAESVLTCSGLGLYLAHHKDFRDYHFFSKLKLSLADWKQIKSLFRIGAPIHFTILNETLADIVLSLYAGWLGKDQLAAQNYGSLIVLFSLIPLSSFGLSTSQQVSREIGEENYENANRYARYGLLSTLAVVLPLCTLVAVSPELLVHGLTNTEDVSEAVLSKAQVLMPITALGIFFDAARYNMLQVLRAADDHVIPTAISIATLWLGVGLAGALGFYTRLDIDGVVLGFTLGLASGSMALLPRWLKKLTPDALAQIAAAHRQPVVEKAYELSCWDKLSLFCRGYRRDAEGLESLLDTDLQLAYL